MAHQIKDAHPRRQSDYVGPTLCTYQGVWCIQCVFTLSSGFHASLFNKMAQGGLEASWRSFRQGRVLKKLGTLSVMEGDEGYRILCTSSKKSAAVTYFSELLPEFSVWGDGGVHITWCSHGVHVGFICRNVEKFYWFGGARRATSQKKFAVTVGDVFGSSGVWIESSKKVRVPGFKDKRCGH